MTLTLDAAMEIRFCDLCHESIPDADFETGRAVAIDGRTMCVACGLKRSLSLAGPRSWLTLLLGLYAAGVTTWLLVKRGDVAQEMRAESAGTLAQAEAGTRRAVEGLETRLAGVADGIRPQLDRLSQDQGLLAAKLEADRSALHSRLDLLQGRSEAVERQSREVHEWLRELKARAERELAQPKPVEPTPAPAPPVPPEPAPAPAPAPAPEPPPEAASPKPDAPTADPAELDHWIDLLQDPNASIAFSATISLARLKDLKAVAPLVKALRTYKDFYVRLGAADALRELKACDGVPDLIDALNDNDDLVRSSADMALKGITLHEEPFAPSLGRQELRRLQTAWRKWWKENEAATRERLKQPPRAN